MNPTFQRLIEKILHGHNPYSGFPEGQWGGTWYNDPGANRAMFKKVLDKCRPQIVVEIGSFVGESTIHMAKILQQIRPDSVIISVDTWMGGIDHWMKVPEKLKFHFGRPSLYYQFIANVIAHKCHETIVPLSMDSINASRLLKFLGIQPNMVYVDASHEEGDVMRDYEAYWDLLLPGGAFLVDDLTGWFPGVLHDWDVFIKKYNLKPTIEGEKGLVFKP